MLMISKKEWQQFFNSITGFAVVAVFLLLNGLLLFVFPDSSILQFGYATLKPFFDFAPWVMLFLIPAITMRSFSEEYKVGTFEILKTLPINQNKIVWGKFLGCLSIVITALIPTFIYCISIQLLSSSNGIDWAATVGSYFGLFCLSCVYIAVGITVSSYTNNAVIAFIAAAFICFLLYSGFTGLSKLPFLKGSYDYWVENLGLEFHYNGLSKGVLDTRDIIYFLALVISCNIITTRKISIA